MDWKISDPITCSGSVCPLPEKSKKFLLVHEFSNYDLKYHIFKEGMWYTALFSNDHFLKSKALVAKQGFLFVCPFPSMSVTSKKNSLLYLLQDKFSPAALVLVMEWKDLGCYKM